MSWGVLLSGCPVWFRGFLLVLFAYAFLNFFLAFNGEAGHKQQGDALAPATLRGSSGHWMLFYAAGFGVLLTAYRLPWIAARRDVPERAQRSPRCIVLPDVRSRSSRPAPDEALGVSGLRAVSPQKGVYQVSGRPADSTPSREWPAAGC